MRKYEVVMGVTANDLEVLVNKKVKQGYEPVGGVAAVKNFGGEIEFYQALWNPSA